MKALCWHGKNKVQIDEVADPQIINPQDAIIRVTATVSWATITSPLKVGFGHD